MPQSSLTWPMIGSIAWRRFTHAHCRRVGRLGYWQVEGYGTDFCLDQYEALAQTITCLKGEAILTINDHPDMRRLFDRFEGETVPIRYTIGTGAAVARRERIYLA